MFVILFLLVSFLHGEILYGEVWNSIDLAKGEWRESAVDLIIGSNALEVRRSFYTIPHDLSEFAKDWHFNLPDIGRMENPRRKITPSEKDYGYKYDDKGRLIECALVDDNEQSWVKITYEADKCTLCSNLGDTVIYGLDGPYLAYVEKANVGRCTYSYIPHPHAHQCLLEERREKGSWTKISYDENGKIQLVHHSKDEGKSFTLSCSLEYKPHLTIVTDGREVTHHYHFNGNGQVEKIETFLPDGELYRIQEFEWQQNLLVRKTILDGKNHILVQERMGYDGRQNLIQEFLEGTLTEEGKLLESVVKRYTYDNHDRLIQEEMDGLTISYTYSGDKRKPAFKFVKDEGKVVETTAYTYDAHDQLIETKVDDGIHQVVLEEMENEPVEAESKDDLYTYTYDCFGRKASCTTLPVLDEDDRPVQWTTTYIYDPLDRVVGVISPAGTYRKMVYNARGQLLATYYPDGSVERKYYTLSGRLRKEIFRDHTFASYVWDGLGRLKEKAFYTSDGELIKSTAYIYAGRDLVKEMFSSGSIIAYAYDEKGRKIESINITTGRRVTYEYDAEGKRRQKEWLDAESYILKETGIPNIKEPKIEWVYNERGQTVMQIASQEGVVLYDALKRVEKIDAGHCIRHLRHNFWGQKIKETFIYQERSLTNRWVYDSAGRLLTLIEAEGSKEERRTSYSYTASGKLEREIGPSGIQIRYDYDTRGRLREIESSDGTIHYALTYTAEGHIQTVTDKLNSLVSEREYDAEGQLIKEKLSNGLVLENHYDLIGRRNCLILPDKSHIQYQFEQEHLQAIVRNGKQLPLTKHPIEEVEEGLAPDFLEYDLAGNLVKKVAQGDTFLFTYDALHRLISVQKNGEEARRYAYDLFHRRLIDSVSGSLFIYDGNWEIGRMVDGKISELRILAPSCSAEHGETIAVEGINPWQFANKRKDPVTGLVHFGRRDFDPRIGKFLTPDPLGLVDGANRYEYFPPDYFGLKSMCAWWEDFKQSFVLYFDELKDKILNLFQVLKDTHALKISQVFEHMVGPGFLLLSGYFPTERSTGIYGKGEVNDKVRVSFTNGILTDQRSMGNTLKALSESHGHVNIHYVYRPTKGWVYDIFYSFAVGGGLVSEQAELLAKEWRHMLKEMGEGGKVIHYAHSIGAIESERALHLLTQEEQKMIFIYTFGSPNLAEAHPFQQTRHFVSVHDGVCLLSFINYVKACTGTINNVVFAGSLLNVPFVDHLFNNQTYQDIWKSMGRTFTEWYGTL